MRFLHTSDLHIGKKLETTRSRLSEQVAVLNEIVDICEKQNVQVVLIAGDIFDTFTPSAEAEGVFFDVAKKLSNGKRIVIIVSGNHDDSARLCASKSVSGNSDIYFCDGELESFNKNFLASGIRMEEVGKGYYVVGDGRESVYVGALSYPTELRLKEKINADESYAQKVERWIGQCFENNVNDLPQIFVSHLFMLGGIKTDGERSIELGGARIIDKNLIPQKCVYTALGHLHKRQIVDAKRNIIYSGSILQYSFDETKIEKSVTVFDVNNGEVQNLNVVKLNNIVELFRIKANSLAQAKSLVENLDGFVELTLVLEKPLSAVEHKEFCSQFENVFLKLQFLGGQEFASTRRNLSDREVFVEYYKSRYNQEPAPELLQAFLSVINQIEGEDETC